MQASIVLTGVMSAIEWQTLPIVTGLKHEAINSDLSLGDVVLEVRSNVII